MNVMDADLDFFCEGVLGFVLVGSCVAGCGVLVDVLRAHRAGPSAHS